MGRMARVDSDSVTRDWMRAIPMLTARLPVGAGRRCRQSRAARRIQAAIAATLRENETQIHLSASKIIQSKSRDLLQ